MNRSLTQAWIILGVISLLVSGLLAIFVTGAKVPIFKNIVDIEIIRWILVVHVNLATLVWFTALPLGFIYFSTRMKNDLAAHISWGGFLLSILGVLLLFSVVPRESVAPILSNYIPVLSHQRYYAGITLYLLGIVISILSPKVFVRNFDLEKNWPGFYEIRFGIFVGAMYLLFAFVTIVLAFQQLLPIRAGSEFRIFELGMWGGGHLIQHSVVVFGICCWTLFLSRAQGAPIFARSELFSVFALAGLPLFFVPIILFFDVPTLEYRNGFTMLMRWGIAPPVLLFLGLTLKVFSFRLEHLKSAEVMAFAFSALLLVTGFVFGAFIRGPDMRVPGHYHASIGAITLAFMMMSYLAVTSSVNLYKKNSIWFYGIGQMVFSSGMFVAGFFGMPRKTYGSEQIFTNWGQELGVGMMAVGGTFALIGGILFALAIIPYLKRSAFFNPLPQKKSRLSRLKVEG